jgi:hypothetical protein
MEHYLKELALIFLYSGDMMHPHALPSTKIYKFKNSNFLREFQNSSVFHLGQLGRWFVLF